jgi:hypothetical protein
MEANVMDIPAPVTQRPHLGYAGGMPAEPPVTFSTFLVSLASSALAHLGHAEGVDVQRDPELVRHMAQVLDILAVKTRGNLDSEEARLIEALQVELRRALGESPPA